MKAKAGVEETRRGIGESEEKEWERKTGTVFIDLGRMKIKCDTDGI